jgi:hypothetical protein
MAAYLNYLQATYGALDDAAVANITTAIHAPFNPSKEIGAELQAFTRNIALLPVPLRGKYVDTEKISIVLASLRPEEALKVNNDMDSKHPVKHTRTWDQFSLICRQQVTLYRNDHPIVDALVAAAGGGKKKGGNVAEEKKYCFGHNTDKHSGDACTGLIAYAAEHGKHFTFLSKLKSNRDVTVKGKDITLKAGFLYADKKKGGHEAAPRQGAVQRRRPPAAAASVDGTNDDQDDLSTMSGWNTADGSDA